MWILRGETTTKCQTLIACFIVIVSAFEVYILFISTLSFLNTSNTMYLEELTNSRIVLVSSLPNHCSMIDT